MPNDDAYLILSVALVIKRLREGEQSADRIKEMLRGAGLKDVSIEAVFGMLEIGLQEGYFLRREADGGPYWSMAPETA